jgi:pyruvate/2-oxoglutarate dehydrogenase complex dihydrolipoamide acyltransferase (E2) component
LTEVRVPEGLWDVKDVPEGVVSNWYYDDGAAVEEGTVVAVVMVEKSEFDIVAPASGVLHISADTNAVVVPGSVIATVAADGG